MAWRSSVRETFAGRVRAAARKVGVTADGTRIEFSAADLSHAAGLQTFEENRKLHWVIRDFGKSGELIAVRKGVYRLIEPKRDGKPREKREVMWRFLRMRKRVTVGDLQEAAGVSEDYAGEWLQMLARQGVVKAMKNGGFQLLVDAPEVPSDRAKAEKLRRVRARKKEKLVAALDEAQIRLQEAAQRLDAVRNGLKAWDGEAVKW